MIAIHSETTATLEEVAAKLKVDTITVRRWAHSGVNGRKLETFKVGGAVRTTWEAVQRFSDQSEDDEAAPAGVPARKKQSDDIDRQLKARHGIF